MNDHDEFGRPTLPAPAPSSDDGASEDIASAVGGAAEKGMKALYDLGGDLDDAGDAASGAAGSASEASGAASGAAGSASQAAGAPSAAASAVAAAFGGSEDQGNVDAFFESDALADVEFEIQSLDLTEELNAPYRLKLGLRTEQMDAEPAMLLGANCRISIRRGDVEVMVLVDTQTSHEDIDRPDGSSPIGSRRARSAASKRTMTLQNG